MSYQPLPTDRKFRALLKQGHVGAGRYDEVVKIIYAKDVMTARDVAMKLGGVKKGTTAHAVISIEEVK